MDLGGETMEPTSKTYWITKYLFTTGVKIKKCRACSDPKFVMDGWRLYRLGRDAHETEEAALRRSKEMIAAKLKSLDKQRDQIQRLAEKLQ